MSDHGIPWFAAILIFSILVGAGSAWLFFTDHVADWQIKRLQSRWTRRLKRIFGFLFILSGVWFAWEYIHLAKL